MNRREFYSAVSDYKDEHTLQHSSRPHKYLYIDKNGRYVYEEPKKSRPYSTPNDYTSSNKKTPSNVGQKMANAILEQKRIDKKHGVDIEGIDSDMKALNSMYSDFANNEDKMTNDNLAKLNEAIEALEDKINSIQNAAVLKSYRSYMDSLKGNLNRVTDWAKRRGLLTDEIKHYGTKGQKWGVRHWQNADGTFNEAGKKRYFGKKNGVKEVWDKLNKPIGPFVKEKNHNLIKAKWNVNFNYDYSTPLFYKFTVRPNSAYDTDNKTKIVKNESELYSKAKKSGLESGDKYGYGTFNDKDAERLEKLNKLNKKGKLSYNSKEYDELERLRGKEYYSKHPDEYARDVEHIEKFKNDIDSIKDDGYEFDGPYDPDYGRKRITDEQYERMKSSTSLAYKANKWLSSNMDSNESFDTLDDDRQRNEMFWFAYEDQTIGMWRVADMINSGVPVNKVVNLIENGNGFFPKGNLDKDILGTEGDSLRFEMIEGNYNNSLVNFAKECAKVKENKDEIKHYGTKGQKWGVRKYQNKDGSLTPAGREHYGYGKGNSDTKDYSNNEKGLAVIPGARFVANSIRKKALDKKIENGKKLGRFEQKYAAEKLTIALKNDDKEMVDKLKNVLTSEEYDKAEERSQKLWNKRSIVKKAQKDRDKKKAEYEENLKKDPEHTHKYKSQDMNLAESMSDEDAAKLKSIEDKMVQVAKTNGTSSKEYKDLDAQYGKTEKSIVDKMNKADGTNRYKSINSYNDKNKNIEDIKKKIKPLTPDEEKRFSDLSKNIDKDKSYYFRRDTGRDPKELMKEADEYYDLRYRKKTNDDLDSMSPVDVQHRWNSLYDDSSKSGKKSERRAAFDESTRVTGKEEAEAWKKLAAYYESQQKKKKKG